KGKVWDPGHCLERPGVARVVRPAIATASRARAPDRRARDLRTVCADGRARARDCFIPHARNQALVGADKGERGALLRAPPWPHLAHGPGMAPGDRVLAF